MVKKGLKWMMVLSLMLSIIHIYHVDASSKSIQVTTWNELVSALENETISEVIVNQDIEYTYNYDSTQRTALQIDVSGTKKLYLYGSVNFHHTLGSNFGLVEINKDAQLDIYGSGSFTYYLEHFTEGMGIYIEEGILFDVDNGTLGIHDDVEIRVDCGIVKQNNAFMQTVIYGTKGTVNITGGMYFGNTIFVDGLDYYISGGYFNTAKQYRKTDIRMISGSLNISGGTFRNGIGIVGGTLKADSEIVYLNESGSVSNELNQYTGFIAYKKGFKQQSPKMDAGKINKHLGSILHGTSYPVYFQLYESGYMPTDWHYRISDKLSIYNENKKLVYKTIGKAGFDLKELKAGTYTIVEELMIYHYEKQVDTLTHTFTITIEPSIVNEVDLEVLYEPGKKPASAKSLTKGVEVDGIRWMKYTNNAYQVINENETLQLGNVYRIQISVATHQNVSLSNACKVYINHKEATKVSDLTYYVDVDMSYLQRYLDVYEINRPVPGLHPDISYHLETANTQSLQINWYELNDKNVALKKLSTSDTFKDDTKYQLEIIAQASNNYAYLLNYVTLNRDEVEYEYVEEGKKVIFSTIYDTAKCIQDIEIQDIQYPIAYKTPDQSAVVKTDGCVMMEQNGRLLDWYYETNPGTANPGFSRLDGKFKGENRRHQLYIELQATDGYYFATDEDGSVLVNGIIAQKEADFTYQNDYLQDDGMCTNIVLARTFALANSIDSIFINGVELKNNEYLKMHHETATSETPESNYVYYHDGILEMHDFELHTSNDYNGITTYNDLTLALYGNNAINAASYGIECIGDITIEKEGELYITSHSSSIYTFGSFVMNSGSLQLFDDSYSAIWMLDEDDATFIMNGGNLYAYGARYGIEADDDTPLIYHDGFLLASGANVACVYQMEPQVNEGNIIVSENEVSGIQTWDEKTSLSQYAQMILMKFPLYASQISYKQTYLSWADSGAQSYHIYRKTPTSNEFVKVAEQKECYYIDTVTTGKEYQYQIYAEMHSENSDNIYMKTNKIGFATQLEGKPKLTMKQVSTSKFKLSWSAIDGATRYIIYRKRNDDKMKKVLTLGSKDLEYTTAELPHGDYQFILKAGRYDSKDRVMTSSSNTVKGSVEKLKPSLTLTAGSKSIKASWGKMEGVTNYEVYRATSKSGKYTKLTTTTSTSYTLKNLTKGKEYFLKVRGYKNYKSGDDIAYNVYTDYSSIKSAKAK